MFEMMQSDGEVPGRERKKRKSSRRSSILKKSPARFPLDDLNPNSDDTESRAIGGKHSRKSMGRRVSFAEKLQIKEFHNHLGQPSNQPSNHWNGDDNQMLPMFGNQSSAQVSRKDQNIFNLFPDNPPSHVQEQDQGNFMLAPSLQKSSVNRPSDYQRRKRKSFDIFDYVEEETSDEDRRGILNEFNQTRLFEHDEMEFTCCGSQTIAGEETFVDKTRLFDDENMEFTYPIDDSIANQILNIQQETVEPTKRKKPVVESFCSDSDRARTPSAVVNEEEGHSNASLLAAKYESNKKELMESASLVLQGKTKPDPPSIHENTFHPNDVKEHIVDADCYLEILAQTDESLLGQTNNHQTKRKVFNGHAFLQSLKTKESTTRCSTVDEGDLANKSIYKSEEWYHEMIEKTDSLSHSTDDEMVQPQTNMVQPQTNRKSNLTEITSQPRVEMGVRVADEGLTEPIRMADEGVAHPVQSSKRAQLDPDDGWKSNTSIISALLKLKEANTSVVTPGQGNSVGYFTEVPRGLNESRNPATVTNKIICRSEEWYQQMVQRTDNLSTTEQQVGFVSKTEGRVPRQTRMSNEEENITESIAAQSSKRAKIDSGDFESAPFLKQLKEEEKALVVKPRLEHTARSFVKVPQKAVDDKNSTVLGSKSIYNSEEWYRQMIEKTDTPSSDGDDVENHQDPPVKNFAKVPRRPRVETQSSVLANKSICEVKEEIIEEIVEKTVTDKIPLAGNGNNQDYSFGNCPEVLQGKPTEATCYLQDKENVFSSTADKATTQRSTSQAVYESGKHVNNASYRDPGVAHLHAFPSAVNESLFRSMLSEEMPEVGRIGPVSALVGKIGSHQIKSRREDMNTTQIEQRAAYPSFSQEDSKKAEDPCMIPCSADYDAVIAQDPVKADQLKLISSTFVVEKAEQKPMCLDGDGINPVAEATMIISPPADFQFKPSETYCIPKNDPDAFLNEAVEEENKPGVGKNVELGKTYVKQKETFILPKAAAGNEASKGQRLSIADIQRKAKNRMSWVSREKMIIASTPARGMETQYLNDISAIQEETVIGLTMIASEQDRDDLVPDVEPQSLTLKVADYDEAKQERGNQVTDDQLQSIKLEGEGYCETKQDRDDVVDDDKHQSLSLQREGYGKAEQERDFQVEYGQPQRSTLQDEGCGEAQQRRDNFAADDNPQTLTPPGLNQTERVDYDKTLEAGKMPFECPQSLLQEEMADVEEQERDKTIVPENILDFGKNYETETLLSLENDPAYRKRISKLKEEKAEMEGNVEELMKVLEGKQLDLMAMEENKKGIEKDRKGLDERASMLAMKEKILEAKVTELEIILGKKERLKRDNELVNKRAEELQKKIKEDSEQRKCFVGLIETTNRLLVWSLAEWSRSRVVFKFKFCRLMLTIDFEEIDKESFKTSDILQWNKKIKSIEFENSGHNFRTKSSEFVSTRLRKQVASKCLQEKYRTTKNLNKLLHEVSSMVIASKQLYEDLRQVEAMNNLTVQDSDCVFTRFISPARMLFTKFHLECRIKDKDGDHEIELAIRHIFAKDRTEIFQEMVSKTNEGPMLFSRAAKQIKDFVFDVHKYYFKIPHKLTEPQLAFVDEIFASYC